MKVVWILNSPIGEISNVLGLSRSQSGSWIDAAMDSLMEQTEKVELSVLTTAPISQRAVKNENGITYLCIPAGKMLRGKRIRKKHLALWEKAIQKLEPDLIHIWGTEFSLGYDLRYCFPKIPFLYTMQGVMTYIKKYPYLDLPEMQKYLGLFSRIRCLKYRKEQRIQFCQSLLEQKMIADAEGVIADNEWAISPFLQEATTDKFHFIRLPIKKQFQNNEWVQDQAEQDTIFCIAGRNGMKGIHQVIKAAAILKQDFPRIKVLIPGNILARKPSFIFAPPYLEFLQKIIVKYELKANIVFLGQLTTDEMIVAMKRSKVFVMPSAIENESSTLREAMFLGMPVVTSFAGDIYETVIHEKNGLIYRFEEYEMLAYCVRKLLKEPELSTALGQTAKRSMEQLYTGHNYGMSLSRIYRQIRGSV